MKIGVMFGNPETTTGGNALKFYASVRMDIRRIGAIKEGEDTIGSKTRVKIVKNKVAPPFKEIEFDIMYGEGISKLGDLVDIASNENIIEKAGAWYSYNNAKLGQGRESAKSFLKENPALYEEIRNKVLMKHGIIKDTTIVTGSVDMTTGEITDAEEIIKPTKKNKNLQ
jgi:recombination protein RecA